MKIILHALLNVTLSHGLIFTSGTYLSLLFLFAKIKFFNFDLFLGQQNEMMFFNSRLISSESIPK